MFFFLYVIQYSSMINWNAHLHFLFSFHFLFHSPVISSFIFTSLFIFYLRTNLLSLSLLLSGFYFCYQNTVVRRRIYYRVWNALHRVWNSLLYLRASIRHIRLPKQASAVIHTFVWDNERVKYSFKVVRVTNRPQTVVVCRISESCSMFLSTMCVAGIRSSWLPTFHYL